MDGFSFCVSSAPCLFSLSCSLSMVLLNLEVLLRIPVSKGYDPKTEHLVLSLGWKVDAVHEYRSGIVQVFHHSILAVVASVETIHTKHLLTQNLVLEG